MHISESPSGIVQRMGVAKQWEAEAMNHADNVRFEETEEVRSTSQHLNISKQGECGLLPAISLAYYNYYCRLADGGETRAEYLVIRQ